MVWTNTNPISVGDATKKNDWDKLWNNADFNYTLLNDGTHTIHGILLGNSTNPINATTGMSNGQLLVGQTTADPIPRTMSGDITINSSGITTIGNDKVDSQHYVTGSIDSEHIGNDQVNSQHYVADSIDAEHYAPGSVDQTAIGATAVGQGELKTTTSEVSTAGTANLTFTGGQYGFYPQVKVTSGTITAQLANGLTNASYVTNVYLSNDGAGTASTISRYVQASGELHWIFLLMRNGEVYASASAADHISYGNRGLEHPFPDYDPATDEIIVINPSMVEVAQIIAGTIPAVGSGYMTSEKIVQEVEEDFLRPEKSFLDVFNEMYEVEESKEADWPDIPVTIALPRVYKGFLVSDWRFMPRFDKDGKPLKVSPVKKVIIKPDYITPLQIRKRI